MRPLAALLVAILDITNALRPSSPAPAALLALRGRLVPVLAPLPPVPSTAAALSAPAPIFGQLRELRLGRVGPGEDAPGAPVACPVQAVGVLAAETGRWLGVGALGR